MRLFHRFSAAVALDAQIVGENAATVFVFMAVDAEVLPIRAVGRVVVVIAVSMMDGQQMQSVGFELAGAFGADPAVDGERALAVGLRARACQSAPLLHEIAGGCWC